MSCKIAIVGACSLVGRELLSVLEKSTLPFTGVRLFESEEGIGQRIIFCGQEIIVEELSEHVLKENRFKFIFFASSIDVVREFASAASESEAIIIDNSSYFITCNQEIPIIVPDINKELLNKSMQIVINPSSISTQIALALHPIQKISPITRIVASTYQAVSDNGNDAVCELEHQVEEIEDGKEVEVIDFPKQIAYNVVPQVGEFFNDGWTDEEKLIIHELKNVFENPSLEVAVTSVLVPVLRGHGVSLTVETKDQLTEEQIIEAWREFPSLLYYSCDNNDYPTPWELEGTIDTGVGRLRKDLNRSNCFHFWCVADNVLRGAAYNMVHTAELLF